MRSVLTVPAIAVALICAGCFTREETILIHPDGSASITYEVEGDRAELTTGDAMPDGVGWPSTQTSGKDRDGRETITTTWRKDLGDLNQYPASFARQDDPHRGATLQTVTRLDIERRPTRTIYRFRRVYVGRRAGKFKELQDASVPQDLVEKARKDEASLTPEEREKIFTGLAEYEGGAMWLRAADALGRAAEAGALDVATYRGTTQGLQSWLEDRLTGDYLRRFFLMSEEAQAREEQMLKERFRDDVEQRLAPREREATRFYLDDEEKAFGVTQDLNDERFALTVRMPGTVVSANTWVSEGNEASWTFPGEDLAEGDRVLTAVSVVEHDAAAR